MIKRLTPKTSEEIKKYERRERIREHFKNLNFWSLGLYVGFFVAFVIIQHFDKSTTRWSIIAGCIIGNVLFELIPKKK